MTPQDARSIEKTICLKEKIDALTVERADYKLALALAEDIDLGINDALTHVLMKREGIKEIYSFDQDFDRLKDITRLSS